MEQLTKAEEEIMHLLWKLQRATVSQIIETIPEPKPPHSTISSIVRILERKGVVGHKAYGRTYEYFPLVIKDEYRKATLTAIVRNYFGGSPSNLVSFLAKSGDLTIKDFEEVKKMIDKADENEEPLKS